MMPSGSVASVWRWKMPRPLGTTLRRAHPEHRRVPDEDSAQVSSSGAAPFRTCCVWGCRQERRRRILVNAWKNPVAEQRIGISPLCPRRATSRRQIVRIRAAQGPRIRLRYGLLQAATLSTPPGPRSLFQDAQPSCLLASFRHQALVHTVDRRIARRRLVSPATYRRFASETCRPSRNPNRPTSDSSQPVDQS